MFTIVSACFATRPSLNLTSAVVHVLVAVALAVPAAAALKPLGWSHFLQPLTPEERTNPLLSYYRRLLSADGNTRSEAVSYCVVGLGLL